MRSVYWVRDDLRLHDNQALLEFARESQEGLLVWTPSLSFQRAGARRRSFVLQCLKEMGNAVAARGGELLLLEGGLAQFIHQNHVEQVFYSASPTVEEQRAQQSLQRAVAAQFHACEQNELLAREDLPFSLKDLPDVFTSYRKLVEAQVRVRPPLPPAAGLPASWRYELAGLRTLESATFTEVHPRITPGETAGLARLQEYVWELDRLKVYKETRDGMLEWNDSSKLSPWLSIGALSPREIYRQIKLYEGERGANESTYWLFFELLWRDYFRLVAQKKGAALFSSKSVNETPLSLQQERFAAWCAGHTGDDFVDANMHELNQTGWMSNRGRQNVASYLAKTMQVPWQWGASYFEEHLIDYDACSNWGNWAYLAGVGQDPRNRVFNPQLQASRYDTSGEYRRRWKS
jgi:deoxyribodipyrimidine photo-lyase